MRTSALRRSAPAIIAALSLLGSSAWLASAAQVQSAADIASAVSAFEKLCLQQLPELPKTAAGFKALGYSERTADAEIFARPGGGFAGLGASGVVDDDRPSDRKPEPGKATAGPFSGCLVYVKGLETAPVVEAVDAMATRRFKKSARLDDAKTIIARSATTPRKASCWSCPQSWMANTPAIR